MKKSNISNLLLTLVGSIYLFISLVVGIITEADKDFWVGFAFFSFGAIIAFAILLIFANSKTTIRDAFFNAPVYYVGAGYFAANGIISLIHMLSGAFSIKWLFIVQLIVFALFAIYFIFALLYKSNATNVVENVQEKNAFIRDMSSKLTAIAAICADRDTKIKIEALADEFKYSKPAFGNELAQIEDIIRQKGAVLNYQIENNDFDGAKETADFINKSLLRRNDIAKNIR